MRTKGLTMTEDLELTEQQRLQIFYSFVEVSNFSSCISFVITYAIVKLHGVICS